MVSAGFSCEAAVVVDGVVLVDDELSVITTFLSFLLCKNEIDTGTVRILVVIPGLFLFYLPSL